MAMNDPLENIMTMLRQKGAVEPGTTGQMLPGMQMQRGNLGAGIPQQGGAPLPDQPSVEEGTETGMTTPQTALPIIIDALNESIIGLKVEIHRSVDPEERRRLERITEQLRKQVQELGGDPIWADESIEEGVGKLTGQGYVGQNIIENITTPFVGAYQKTVGPYVSSAWDRLSSTLGKLSAGTPTTIADRSTQTAKHSTQDPRRVLAHQSAALARTFGPQIKRDAFEQIQLGGMDDRLTELLKQIGGVGGGGPAAPPKIQFNEAAVNQMLAEYGLKPKTDKELQEHAHAIVERQKLSREQIINREIEKFEREDPPAFAKARDRLTTAAKEYSAEDQEEFASRGIYYSSVMASAVEKRDSETMELIADIANESASYVLGLRRELRDIAEWAVVEEEVVRRELEAENTALKQNLVNIRSQVAMFADQMALDAWHKSESLRVQHQQLGLQAMQMRLQAAAQMGDHYAAAFALNDPLLRPAMEKMGYTPEMVSQMPLDQQAQLGNYLLSAREWDLTNEDTLINNRYVAVNTALKELELQRETFTWQQEQKAVAEAEAKKAKKKKPLEMHRRRGAILGGGK